MPTISTHAGNSKLVYRMRQICLYRVKGKLSDAKIAEMVGLSTAGLAAILKQPEYMEMEEAAMEGSISDLDRRLAEDDEALRREFKNAVPAALTALVETVVQRRDLRARLVAAKEILDRDPSGQFVGARKVDSPTTPGGPALPSEIIASLNAEGNKTVVQIKNAGTTTRIETSSSNDVPTTDVGKNNA